MGSSGGAFLELDEPKRCRDTSCRSSATKLSPSRRTNITGQANTPHRDVAAFFEDRFDVGVIHEMGGVEGGWGQLSVGWF